LERLSERKGRGGTLAFHYGDLSDMPTYATNGEGETTTSYVQGGHGLIEQRSGEMTSYPLRDAHGDVTAIADETGEIASRESYDPWGAQLSGPSIELGYLGAQQRRLDPTSGLIQMGARSYSPTLGTFMSEDPVLGQVGLGITSNRYPYVWNNPLGLDDLDGRFPSPGDVAGAVGGTVDDVWNTGKELVTHPGEAATNAVEYWANSDSPASYVFGPLSVLGDMAINPDRAAYYLEKANPAQMAATGIVAAGTVGVAGVTILATEACYAVTPELEALHVCTGVAVFGGSVAAAGGILTYEIARR
jgi:RHS repeat-associated protein